jgi:NDP-sugar pyrophosphorylase family protein
MGLRDRSHGPNTPMLPSLSDRRTRGLRVAVNGATGFLGAYLTRRLVSDPPDVQLTGVARRPPGTPVAGVAYSDRLPKDQLAETGVYCFRSEVLTLVEPNARLDLLDLMERLISGTSSMRACEFEGYWLGKGRPGDYETAVAPFGQGPLDG